MAKRPFNPEALSTYASEAIRPPIGVGALVWRYAILVPLEERKLHQAETILLADTEDLENLRALLSDVFGGVTVLMPLIGSGLRDPRDPMSLELNKSLPFVVYATPIATSDRYVEKLQQELQEALDQGLVLVERQEVFLLGHYRTSLLMQLARSPSAQLPFQGG